MTPVQRADHWKPGATSKYLVDVVLIELKPVLEFLNKGLAYEADLENEILYILD